MIFLAGMDGSASEGWRIPECYALMHTFMYLFNYLLCKYCTLECIFANSLHHSANESISLHIPHIIIHSLLNVSRISFTCSYIPEEITAVLCLQRFDNMIPSSMFIYEHDKDPI